MRSCWSQIFLRISQKKDESEGYAYNHCNSDIALLIRIFGLYFLICFYVYIIAFICIFSKLWFAINLIGITN